MTSDQLHAVDDPLTIKIPVELLARRVVSGFVQLPSGTNVESFGLHSWDLLTTERAVLENSHRIFIIERCGRFPGNRSVAKATPEAVEKLR